MGFWVMGTRHLRPANITPGPDGGPPVGVARCICRPAPTWEQRVRGCPFHEAPVPVPIPT